MVCELPPMGVVNAQPSSVQHCAFSLSSAVSVPLSPPSLMKPSKFLLIILQKRSCLLPEQNVVT